MSKACSAHLSTFPAFLSKNCSFMCVSNNIQSSIHIVYTLAQPFGKPSYLLLDKVLMSRTVLYGSTLNSFKKVPASRSKPTVSFTSKYNWRPDKIGYKCTNRSFNATNSSSGVTHEAPLMLSLFKTSATAPIDVVTNDTATAQIEKSFKDDVVPTYARYNIGR